MNAPKGFFSCHQKSRGKMPRANNHVLASHNVGPNDLGRCTTKSQALKMKKATSTMISLPLLSSFAPKKRKQIEANKRLGFADNLRRRTCSNPSKYIIMTGAHP
jgi:hypothetical protein